MPIIRLEDALACLEIEELGDDVFTGPNIPMPYYRVFGGQLLAQCIAIDRLRVLLEGRRHWASILEARIASAHSASRVKYQKKRRGPPC